MIKSTDRRITLRYKNAERFFNEVKEFIDKNGIDGEHLSPTFPMIAISSYDDTVFELTLESFDWTNTPIRKSVIWRNKNKAS